MVTTEKEMVRKLAEVPPADRTTSLQATYEDTVPPNPEDDWEFEQD